MPLPSGPLLPGVNGDSGPYFSVSYLQEPRPKAEVVVTRLLLDSRDLVTSIPGQFSGTFNLASSGHGRFENVIACELKALAFPKVSNERYVTINIPTITDETLAATNSVTDRSFAVCYFDSDALLPGAVKPLKGSDFYQKTIRFRPAINKLERIDISFLKYGGNVVTSADVGGVANVQYSMMLEVSCLNNRNW